MSFCANYAKIIKVPSLIINKIKDKKDIIKSISKISDFPSSNIVKPENVGPTVNFKF